MRLEPRAHAWSQVKTNMIRALWVQLARAPRMGAHCQVPSAPQGLRLQFRQRKAPVELTDRPWARDQERRQSTVAEEEKPEDIFDDEILRVREASQVQSCTRAVQDAQAHAHVVVCVSTGARTGAHARSQE